MILETLQLCLFKEINHAIIFLKKSVHFASYSKKNDGNESLTKNVSRLLFIALIGTVLIIRRFVLYFYTAEMFQINDYYVFVVLMSLIVELRYSFIISFSLENQNPFHRFVTFNRKYVISLNYANGHRMNGTYTDLQKTRFLSCL